MSNATHEHPGLDILTDDASCRVVISDPQKLLMGPQHEFNQVREFKMRCPSSATGLGIDDPKSLADVNEPDSHLNWHRRPHFGLERVEFRFIQYDLESSTAILMESWSDEIAPEPELDPGYQQVIDNLRNGGREIPAEDLIEILRNTQDDPDAPKIKIFSLKAMARFLIEHRKFDDPIIGPDPMGVMQVEWHIIGDGLLVMVFVDDDCIHCVAQADATDCSDALNRSVQLTERQSIEEFGHLVPLR